MANKVLEPEKSRKILEYVKSILIAVVLALLIRTFIIQAFKIPSGSMENTLLIGDHLFVTKFIYNVALEIPFTPVRFNLFSVSKPKRGDIVVFVYPLDENRDFIKRCIGVPGDKIEVKDKVLYVNDKAMEEKYVIHKDDMVYPRDMQPRDNFGPITVPEGRYFMMGDNRDTSLDSRFWGFLEYKYIKGKALIKYWPPMRIGLIK